MPTRDARLFDLKKAAQSKTYCEEVKGTLAQHGVGIIELATHLQGQLVAVHPAYDNGFDGFAAPKLRGNPVLGQDWAVQQLMPAAQASANLGLTAHVTFWDALAWPCLYSWPPRPASLIEGAFDELAKRWRPILDAFDNAGVDVCYEVRMTDEAMVEKMHAYGRNFPSDVNEIEQVGLHTAPSLCVAPPRIVEAPAAFECVLHEKLETPSRYVFIGRVKWLCARPGLVDTQSWRVDLRQYHPVGRFGASFYVDLRERFVVGEHSQSSISTDIDEI